jgi:hypothetical protein
MHMPRSGGPAHRAGPPDRPRRTRLSASRARPSGGKAEIERLAGSRTGSVRHLDGVALDGVALDGVALDGVALDGVAPARCAG